jgi:hypothetical protein
MKRETDTAYLLRVIEKHGGFVRLECGTWCFVPQQVQGGMSERDLRAVAKELKRRNALPEADA